MAKVIGVHEIDLGEDAQIRPSSSSWLRLPAAEPLPSGMNVRVFKGNRGPTERQLPDADRDQQRRGAAIRLLPGGGLPGRRPEMLQTYFAAQPRPRTEAWGRVR